VTPISRIALALSMAACLAAPDVAAQSEPVKPPPAAEKNPQATPDKPDSPPAKRQKPPPSAPAGERPRSDVPVSFPVDI
jgi:hypothetical protein